MIKDNYTITFLDKNLKICEETRAYFVDIVERDENNQILNQVIGTVDRESIKKQFIKNKIIKKITRNERKHMGSGTV